MTGKYLFTNYWWVFLLALVLSWSSGYLHDSIILSIVIGFALGWYSVKVAYKLEDNKMAKNWNGEPPSKY